MFDSKSIFSTFYTIMSAITITFGDVAENHVKMQKIGKLAEKGFSTEDLVSIQKNLGDYKTEFLDLGNDASVLIVRNFVVEDELYNELKNLEWDDKAKMYGKVLNKKARHNLCFSDEDQEPDYENGKGRVVSFDKVPILTQIKNRVCDLVDTDVLQAEGNYYYDLKKCGIGWHGDAERKKVVGLRLGDPFLLCYRWYLGKNPTSEKIEIELDHGDIYIMNEKASGNDWKKRKIPTLRHSAGLRGSKYVE